MLEIQNLTVRFQLPQGTITALEGVNLTLRDGEKLCVVGESGSGKSVLMLAVLCLLPENACVSGSILLDGEDLLQKSQKDLTEIRGMKLSYVPQGSGNSLNPLLRLGFQVSESLVAHRRLPRRGADQRSIQLLQQFHLGDEEQLVRSYPHTLSGGMRQRALLALGIAPEAPYLVADEPTEGLDSDRVGLVVDCFNSLEGCSLLCVTHDLTFAQQVADRVAIIYAGQMIEYETAERFFGSPRHPYSKALLDAVPERGLNAIPGFSPGHEDYTDACRFYNRCPCRTAQCQTQPKDRWDGERMVKCIYGAP